MKPPIIITGCHRSGTTIAAHILGQELGCAVIDDLQFMPDKEHFDKLRVMIDNDITKFIVLCHSALQIPVHIFHVFPELHWVGITRKKEDIINSMKRIHWCKNDVTNWHQFLNDHVNHTRQSWGVAKSILPKENWTELKYESLKKHPLFIPKEQRENFTVKQWKLNEPCGMKYWENNYECYMEKMNG